MPHAPCPSPTGWRASGSTPRSPGCSASPARGGRPDRRRAWSGRRARGGEVRPGARRGDGSRSTIPPPADPLAVVPEPVEGIEIVHDDDDLVVIDKPVGVAAHPSPGLDRPHGDRRPRRRRLPDRDERSRRAPGHRAPAGRRHHRASWWSRSRARLLALKHAFRERDGRQDLPRAGAGSPRPAARHDRRPDRAPPELRPQVRRHRRGKPASPTTRRSRPSGPPACSRSHLETGRTHQIRVHMAALRHPCVGDPPTAPTRAGRSGSASTRQWLHAVRLGFEHPVTGEWVEYESPYPADLAHALDVIRDAD